MYEYKHGWNNGCYSIIRATKFEAQETVVNIEQFPVTNVCATLCCGPSGNLDYTLLTIGIRLSQTQRPRKREGPAPRNHQASRRVHTPILPEPRAQLVQDRQPVEFLISPGEVISRIIPVKAGLRIEACLDQVSSRSTTPRQEFLESRFLEYAQYAANPVICLCDETPIQVMERVIKKIRGYSNHP